MTKRIEAIWVVAGILMILAAAVFHVTFYDHLVTKKYIIAQLQDGYQKLIEEYAALVAENEQLSSPARIQALSFDRLDMKQPRDIIILQLNPPSSSTDRVHLAEMYRDTRRTLR